MKITLDLTDLVSRGELTKDEADKLSKLAARDTGSLGANILLGFGTCTGINQLDLYSNSVANLFQQIGIRSDQTLGIGRVTPKVGRIIRTSGGYQFVAATRSHCINRQQP